MQDGEQGQRREWKVEGEGKERKGRRKEEKGKRDEKKGSLHHIGERRRNGERKREGKEEGKKQT